MKGHCLNTEQAGNCKITDELEWKMFWHVTYCSVWQMDAYLKKVRHTSWLTIRPTARSSIIDKAESLINYSRYSKHLWKSNLHYRIPNQYIMPWKIILRLMNNFQNLTNASIIINNILHATTVSIIGFFFPFSDGFVNSQKATFSFIMSVLMSVRRHGRPQLPLKLFSWILIFEFFSKNLFH